MTLHAAQHNLQSYGVPTITPERALVLSKVSGCRDVGQMVCEHAIHQGPDGGWRLGAGQPMAPAQVGALVEELSESAVRRAPARILPPEVVAMGEDMVAWHVPGRVRPMFFRLNPKMHPDGQCVLHVPWPSLLCVARGSRLWLAALDSPARPGPDTPLYHAPLMNHDAHYGLCFGGYAPPREATPETIPSFEAGVFETNFTHITGGNHLRYRGFSSPTEELDEDTHLAFWRGLEKQRRKHFPTRHLLPLNTTLAEAIQELTQ